MALFYFSTVSPWGRELPGLTGKLASLDLLGLGEGSTARPSILFPACLKDRDGGGVRQPAALGTHAAGKGLDLNIKVLKMTGDRSSSSHLASEPGWGWGRGGSSVSQLHSADI